MFGDAERPLRLRAQQEAQLRAYIRRQVYPYSAFNRSRLTAAGIGVAGVKSSADLERVTPVSWAEVGDGAELVLRPQTVTMVRLGDPTLAMRVLFARVLGRGAALNRTVIDPVYRPIQWIVQQGVPVGMSANDLDRLGEVGRRWLESAGIRPADVVVSLNPVGGGLDYIQLAAGCRRAGVTAAFVDTRPSLADVARLHPTVLAGRGDDIVAVLKYAASQNSPALSDVHTVLVTGAILDEERRSSILRMLGHDVTVLGAWAPDGVRALWAECRGASGYHTWPAAEILQVADSETFESVPRGRIGEIVWTALGWAGTVVIRLRTGVRGVVDESPCAACGRTTPRVLPVAGVANFASVLDAHPGVSLWQAELTRRNGSDELVVFLTPSRPGHPGRLVRDLDFRLRKAQPATQFVVLSADKLDQRLAERGSTKIIDKRPL